MLTPGLLSRLCLLVGLAILPAVGLLAIGAGELRERRTETAREQALGLARDAASRLAGLLHGVHGTLAVLAAAPAVGAGDAAGCGALLAAARAHLGAELRLEATGANGAPLCADGDAGLAGAALLAAEPRPGRVLIAPAEGATALVIGLPIGAAAAPSGLVTAAIDLRWLGEFLGETALPAGGGLLLADRTGCAYLAIGMEGPPCPGAETPLRSILRSAPGPEGKVADGAGPDGRPRILGVVAAKDGLRVAVCLDAQALMAPVREASLRGVLLISAGVLLALLAVVTGSRLQVLRPIDVLRDAAERWRSGHYGLRAVPRIGTTIPELRSLAEVLDSMAEAADGRDRARQELREAEARLGLVLAASGLAAWEYDPRRRQLLRPAGHARLFGLPGTGADWRWRDFLGHVVPEDRARVSAAYRSLRRFGNGVRLDFRIRRVADGEVRWLEARAALHEFPSERPKLLGVLVDVTDQRVADARVHALMHELDERLGASLATVEAIARQTFGTAGSTVTPGAQLAFQQRLQVLARAHALLAHRGWTGADLHALAESVLAPYGGSLSGPRYRLQGPPVRVVPARAVPLALALHELAVNAVRHGALCRPDGVVELDWRVEPERPARPVVILTWRERSGAPPQQGLGLALLEGPMARDLAGEVRVEFLADGLVCTLRLPLAGQDGWLAATGV